jgi:hypothetical protein
MLFVWPLLDLFGYAVIPQGPSFVPYLHGSMLGVGVAFTAAIYAWIPISGR